MFLVADNWKKLFWIYKLFTSRTRFSLNYRVTYTQVRKPSKHTNTSLSFINPSQNQTHNTAKTPGLATGGFCVCMAWSLRLLSPEKRFAFLRGPMKGDWRREPGPSERLQFLHPERSHCVTGHPPRRRKLRITRVRPWPNARSFRCASSPRKNASRFSGVPCTATGGGKRGRQSVSNSSIHNAATASDGIRQSPRGLRATEPTLGPSGRQERLNCWAKNRR